MFKTYMSINAITPLRDPEAIHLLTAAYMDFFSFCEQYTPQMLEKAIVVPALLRVNR